MAKKLKTFRVMVDFMSSMDFEIEAYSEEDAVEKAQLLAEDAVSNDEFVKGEFNFEAELN